MSKINTLLYLATAALFFACLALWITYGSYIVPPTKPAPVPTITITADPHASEITQLRKDNAQLKRDNIQLRHDYDRATR